MPPGEFGWGQENVLRRDSQEQGGLVDRRGRETIVEQYIKYVSPLVNKLQYGNHTLTEKEKGELFLVLEKRRDFIREAFVKEKKLQSLILSSSIYLAGFLDYDKQGEVLEENMFKRFGLEIITVLLPDIHKALEEQHVPIWKGLDAFVMLTRSTALQDQQSGSDALVEHLDLIEDGLHKDSKSYLRFVRAIFKCGNHQQIQTVVNIVDRVIQTANEKECSHLISSFFIDDGMIPADLFIKGQKHVDSVLEQRGLPKEDFFEAWLLSTNIKSWGEVVYRNLNVMRELEEAYPRACLFLYKKFGIMDFGRYPTELLLRQIEEYDERIKPYGVILYPRHDWNGAFYESASILEDFFKKIRDEFSLRVVECDGKMDVVKTLIAFNRKYNPPDGSGHKISLAIIGGHGTKDRIAFGGSDARHSLFTKDLMGRGTTKASQFFEENPTIILVSCSTGAEQGIGQELSVKLGAKVIAPTVPSALSALHANKKRGQKAFRFNAEYTKKPKKSIFLQGERIS